MLQPTPSLGLPKKVQWNGFERKGVASWQHTSAVRAWDVKGVYKTNGTAIMMDSQCVKSRGWCRVISRSIPDVFTIPVRECMKFAAHHQEQASVDPTVFLTGYLGIGFYTDGGWVTDLGTREGKKGKILGRCDTNHREGGCVNHKFSPIVVYKADGRSSW
jgi:hypothetical protein